MTARARAVGGLEIHVSFPATAHRSPMREAANGAAHAQCVIRPAGQTPVALRDHADRAQELVLEPSPASAPPNEELAFAPPRGGLTFELAP